MFRTNFLTNSQAKDLAAKHGTPIFVYSRQKLVERAEAVKAMPAPFGKAVRYAMKANPHPEVLNIFRQQGIGIDASSEYEAKDAIANGFKPSDILLTSQQSSESLRELVGQGVQFNATSLRQLENYGKLFPNTEVSVRLNPGVGSGHSVKTNVGGVTSSFGIWHEYIPQIQELLNRYKLRVKRVHTHIGSGTEPAVWEEAARVSLELIKNFSEATIINLGGGFKVARMDEEQGSDMAAIGAAVAQEIEYFRHDTGRKLHLEVEPGTLLVANAGILISRVDDITDTGETGYQFIKLDTGMTDILRPSLYGSQQPIAVLGSHAEIQEYVVVGHCCESGDLLTPAPAQPDILAPRHLTRAEVGDLVLIGGVGAYCAAMSARGYNSFPAAKEVII